MPLKLKTRRLKKFYYSKKRNSKQKMCSTKNKYHKNIRKSMKGGFYGRYTLSSKVIPTNKTCISIFDKKDFKQTYRPKLTKVFKLYNDTNKNDKGTFTQFTADVADIAKKRDWFFSNKFSVLSSNKFKFKSGFKITKPLVKRLPINKDDEGGYHTLKDECLGLHINAYLNSQFNILINDRLSVLISYNDTLIEQLKKYISQENKVGDYSPGIWSIVETAIGGDLFFLLVKKWSHIKEHYNSYKKLFLIIFYQLCLSLKYCHDKGITYADLKPENVFLKFKFNNIDNENPTIKFKEGKSIKLSELKYNEPLIGLGDFGTSYQTKKNEYPIEIGTLEYESPEILCIDDMGEIGLKVKNTNTVDIWALGCIYHNLLFGIGIKDVLWSNKDNINIWKHKFTNDEFFSKYNYKTDLADLDLNSPDYKELISRDIDKQILTRCFSNHSERITLDELINILETNTGFTENHDPDNLKKYIIKLYDGGFYINDVLKPEDINRIFPKINKKKK